MGERHPAGHFALYAPDRDDYRRAEVFIDRGPHRPGRRADITLGEAPQRAAVLVHAGGTTTGGHPCARRVPRNADMMARRSEMSCAGRHRPECVLHESRPGNGPLRPDRDP
jgi:hypothetical protein